MNKKAKLMIVDDEQIVRQSLKHWFEEDGYLVETASDGESAFEKFERGKFDLLFVDMKMPGMSGLDLLIKVKAVDPDVVVILITAFASVPSAIKALKNGAFDYITKPIDPDELSHLAANAVKQRELKLENIALKSSIDQMVTPDALIGESKEMKKILAQVTTVAPTDTNIIIRGENGTGKELLAKAIHTNSQRKYKPFVSVNCSVLSDQLIECDLFGHEKDALSGLHFKRRGKLETVAGGTLFLDEVASLSPSMQFALLKIIESKQFQRIGSTDAIATDFRLIAATNAPLDEMVKEGTFREDLYYKMNVVSIALPTLRERIEDIPILTDHFLKKFTASMNKCEKSFSREAMDFLMNYEWPGNVRELENAIERAVVVSKKETIEVDDLPFRISSQNYYYDGHDKSLSAMEKKHITIILHENKWNISRSAEMLNIDRVTLYNKISKYGLQRKKRGEV
ncbi:MAG: sigma-54-dependent Fis family transcriptional regulator [Ignavibacteriales bacterium]|nr:MAG: sigma-54-dependent Fis family transcriptional regulator [Ignavibacteriales bacterium]